MLSNKEYQLGEMKTSVQRKERNAREDSTSRRKEDDDNDKTETHEKFHLATHLSLD